MEKFLWIIIFWIELLKKKNSEKRIEFFSSSFSFLIFLFLNQILFFILISIDGKISLNNNFLKRIIEKKKGKIMKKELSFFLFRFSYFYFLTSQILFFILILIDGKISLNNNFSNRIIEKKKNSEKRIEFFSSSFSFLIFVLHKPNIIFYFDFDQKNFFK